MKSITKLIILFICSISFAQTNLLDTSTWTVGTGSVAGFNHTGTDIVNVREMATGPHNTQVLLWKRAAGISSSSSGGFLTDYFNIDNTKTYRFSIWIKKTNSDDGRTLFGFNDLDTSGSSVDAYKLSGAASNNPYFYVGDTPSLDTWYLYVAYLHHSGYADTVDLSGIYNAITGNKEASMNDFKFDSTTSQILYRTFLYDETNIDDSQYFYAPAIYEVNGQEPTIQELIDGPDTQAPTTSTLSNSTKTDTTVDLSWTAATDDTAVTGYKVYKDAVLETTLGNVLTYQVTGLTASTAYNFTVTALDAAGNESVVSNTLAVTTNNGPLFDSAYQAILDEATIQGYTLPSVSDQIIQNTKVVSAKASGIWDLSDRIWVFTESGDAGFKSINWKNPSDVKLIDDFNNTRGEGTGFVYSSTGVKGDGYRFFDTGFNPSTMGVNWTQNNAGMYVKVVTSPVLGYNVVISNFNTTNDHLLILENLQQRINNSSPNGQTYDFSNATGLLGVSRPNASSLIINEDTTLTTNSVTSESIANANISLLGWSWASAPASWTSGDAEIGYVILGSDMSDKITDIKIAFDTTSTDTQSPTASTLSSTVKTDTTVDLSWTAATDNVAVTNYKVYKDAVLETTLGNVLTYQVTGLTASTAYNFTVTALDAVGNESVASNTLAITTNATSGSGSGYWSLNNQDIYYNTGNVGVGTATPDEKLAVNGNIHTKEVRVDLTGWSDFVFEKDYKLPSLKEVEKHIKEKGHLKDIPSAKNVEEHGILLGGMNAKLLQKIEELTLYILQQQKILNKQAQKNEMLENRLTELEKLTKE